MKKLLLSSALITAFYGAQSQCSDFFMSEYVEGWSNNKSIEIYNPFNQAKNLNGYWLQRYRNGAQTPSNPAELNAMVDPYDVYVVTLDKRDPNGSGLEAPVWDDLQLKTDTFVNPNYNSGSETMYFNGNDAVVLVKDNGQTIVDIFGKVGEDPGDGWGAYTDANGDPAAWTADHTLVRKATVTSGVSTNPVTFDPSLQWDSLPANTFTELQSHTCDCETSSINEISRNAFFLVYPNPVTGGVMWLRAEAKIEEVEIFNILGQSSFYKKNEVGSEGMRLDAVQLSSGVYVVKAQLDNGKTVVKKITVK